MKNDRPTSLILSFALVTVLAGSAALAQFVPPAPPGPYQPMYQPQYQQPAAQLPQVQQPVQAAPPVQPPVQQPAQTGWPQQQQNMPYWMQQPQPQQPPQPPVVTGGATAQQPQQYAQPNEQAVGGYNGRAGNQYFGGGNVGGGYGFGPSGGWNNGWAPVTGGYQGYPQQGTMQVPAQQAPYPGANAWPTPWNPYGYGPAQTPAWGGYPQYVQPGYPAQGGWR